MVCLLRNGAYYLDALLRHHRSIGVSHFVFIDNGSEDDTVARLSAEPDVTVISNPLPVARYESLMRVNTARRCVRGGWFLFADSDELMEMPHGEGRSIRDYVRYCDRHGYTAVVGQCLDLVSDRPLSETREWSYERAIREFTLYSLASMDEFDYHSASIDYAWFLQPNRVSNPAIRFRFGGLRRELFGEYCGLTNHRLVKNSKDIWIYSHPHCSTYVTCADFTLLLRHYKFAGHYLQRELRQVSEKVWDHGEDVARLAVVNDGDFVFKARNMHRFTGTARLLEQGFLTGSAQFLAEFPPPEGSEQSSGPGSFVATDAPVSRS